MITSRNSGWCLAIGDGGVGNGILEFDGRSVEWGLGRRFS